MKASFRTRLFQCIFVCAAVASLACPSCRRAEVRGPSERTAGQIGAEGRVSSLLESGRFEEALAATDSLIAAGGGDARTLGERARALEGLGRSAEAIAAYEEAILKDYENCENHLNFATYLMRIGKSGRALTEFGDAKTFCGSEYLPLIYRNLAVAEIKLGRNDRAKQYVDEGLQTSPDDPYLCGLEAMLIAGERPVAAESLFAKARTVGNAPAEFLLQYGLLLLNEGRFAEAIDVLEAASEGKRGDREIMLALAEAYDRAGRYRDAEDILNALRTAPDGAEVAGKLAGVLLHKGDYTEALALYLALERTPQVMDHIATCLHKLGRTDEAIPWERKALAAEPQWPQAMINLAVLLAAKGELDEATALLERALALEPDNVTAKMNLERLKKARREGAQRTEGR
jgi:tetratricopeptide (TPR) repeat protein